MKVALSFVRLDFAYRRLQNKWWSESGKWCTQRSGQIIRDRFAVGGLAKKLRRISVESGIITDPHTRMIIRIQTVEKMVLPRMLRTKVRLENSGHHAGRGRDKQGQQDCAPRTLR